MNLRSRWLNFIMHLTSAIAERKQDLTKYHAIKTFFDVLTVVFLEGVLAIVSIPLYFFMKVESLSPENEFNVQYVVRKTLTFTFLFLLLLLLVAKAVVVGKVIMNNLMSNSVLHGLSSDSSRVFAYFSSPVDYSLKPPVVTKVEDSADLKKITVEGTSAPHAVVLVHLMKKENTNDFAQIYTATANDAGVWRLTSNSLFHKADGDYVVKAQSYDESSRVKSPLGPSVEYRFSSPWGEQVLYALDLLANVILVSFIGIGFLVVFLTF
ncbi:MAG: hypothetical protein U0519_00355 [Candidatus Gracilibacteria bacterium]